jgi:type II secretory pathway pseudopilin PulG
MKSARFSQRPRKPSTNRHERGYILLTLIFFVAVLAISLATILPSIKQEILRDREEEMVHRGVQYTRAIRLYYKKNGRYPAKIEDLESSNNLRFLRKRYKDPTVKGEDSPEADFKILRFGDPNVQLGIAGQIPGAQGLPGQPGLNGTLTGPNALGSAARLSGSQNNLDFAQKPTPSDPNQNPDASTQDAAGNPPAATGTPATDPAAAPQDQEGTSKPADNPIQGGGAMVGVVSSNANTFYPAIREYNKKRHYSEWQFIYDPQNDRGGLPNGPWQPPKFLGQAGSGPQQIGTPAGQISNPVGQPPAQNGANPTPPSDQPQ